MTVQYTPPAFVERYQYKNCVQVNDPVTRKRVYLTPDGESLPSVTTILSATKDMTHLNEWKKRVGAEKAQQIVTEASGRGTSMHQNLESFIAGVARQQGNNLVHQIANKMADNIIQNGLKDVDEVWAMEQSLYYPEVFSGTTDLVCVHKGIPCIADYKQSNKPKDRKWIDDYFMQLLFYGTAHNKVYGTDIQKGIIFMAVKPPVNEITGEIGESTYQEFVVEGAEWKKYESMMWDKIEAYYKLV
jgi:genome maintenance exonuclease 1